MHPGRPLFTPCYVPTRILWCLLIVSLLIPPALGTAQMTAAGRGADQEPTPAFLRLNEMMDVLDDGRDDILQAFIDTSLSDQMKQRRSPDELFAIFQHIAAELKGAEVLEETSEGPYHLRRLVQSIATGEKLNVGVMVEEQPPHRIRMFMVMTPGPMDDPQLAPILQNVKAGIRQGMSDSEKVVLIETLFQELSKINRFSGTALVARGEEVLFTTAQGRANYRYEVPNRVDTRINIGSINKSFTAVAIAVLVEEGRLAFDDPVAKHIPDYPLPEVAQKVTLHHLLTHTSGIADYWNDEFERHWHQIRTVEELLPYYGEEPLAFEPGEQWSYSNGGFALLGLIIERVSGMDYYDFMRERVYAPAGMVNTDCYELDKAVPNLAFGYLPPEGDGLRRSNIFLHASKGSPAGGGYATVEDFHRFFLALQNGTLVSKEMLQTMITPKAEMGPGHEYGYGFGVNSAAPITWIGHTGGAPGINAVFHFNPETGWMYAVLANTDGGAMLPGRVIRAVLGESPEALR
ncbi:serine hydrolase [bacterium]|nr:serine hydrolase [bacterium]